MRNTAFAILILVAGIISGCSGGKSEVTNPWLVPFRERHASETARSQMRAMVRLANIYRDAGLHDEYVKSLMTGVALYAGDQNVTFELLNVLIDDINTYRVNLSESSTRLILMGIDPSAISDQRLPEPGTGRSEAEYYLATRKELEQKYEQCFNVMRTACNQIPYNAELYYRTAYLQYLRAGEDGDEDKYRDAINFLKRSIASDSGHLESYHLIAVCYEKIGDMDRALRFWRLFEVIYEIAPEVIGEGYITTERENLHAEALEHLENLASQGYE